MVTYAHWLYLPDPMAALNSRNMGVKLAYTIYAHGFQFCIAVFYMYIALVWRSKKKIASRL